jgi:[citrate (pro-3S)-lyase] ligase
MTDYTEQVLILSSQVEIEKLENFLKKQSLTLEKGIEYAVVLTEESRIVASGAFEGNVLKCIAVDKAYQTLDISARVVTRLVEEELRRGRTHLLVYTKPENGIFFSALGFLPVAEVPDKVLLMDNKSTGVRHYLDKLLSESGKIIPSAAVVLNCNPFTTGHLHLIEYAASMSAKLHIFIVREDKSAFPFAIRHQLVKDGVRHLTNVVVHEGKDYIISNATFPSYFLKDSENVAESQAQLDLTVFGRYIAPALLINKRFVGEEPECEVTSVYNKVMKDLLPSYGIEVVEIPRLRIGRETVSASLVREYIRAGEMESVEMLVPDTTFKFLLSPEAVPIVRDLRS